MALSHSRIVALVEIMVGQLMTAMEEASVEKQMQLVVLTYLRSPESISATEVNGLRGSELLARIDAILEDTEIRDYLGPLREGSLIAFPGAKHHQIVEIAVCFDVAFAKHIAALLRQTTNDSLPQIIHIPPHALQERIEQRYGYTHPSISCLCPPRFRWIINYPDEPWPVVAIKSAIISCSIMASIILAAVSPVYIIFGGIELALNIMQTERTELEKAGFVFLSSLLIPLGMLIGFVLIGMITPVTASLVNTVHFTPSYRRIRETAPSLTTPLLAAPERMTHQLRVSV